MLKNFAWAFCTCLPLSDITYIYFLQGQKDENKDMMDCNDLVKFNIV